MKRRYAKQKSEGKIAHKITEVDGIKFHSKMESEYYLYLKELKANGKIKDFELQPEFLLQEKFIIVDGVVIKGSDSDFDKIKRKSKAITIQAISYIADFKIYYNDGTSSIEDTKGQSTPEFELKKKMFMLAYPNLPLNIIIFDERGLVEKGSWVDFYAFKKAERAAKRKRKAAKLNKEVSK